MNEHPDCTIHHCEQRSDEWFELRRGILTASEFGAWLLKRSDKRSKDARDKAICKLVAQTANAWEKPNFEDAIMQRGTELEPTAVAMHEQQTGETIRPVGFCKSIHGRFGCSPDGLITGKNRGFEGKVPLPSTHVFYRRRNELPSEYYWQVQGSMAVTGAESWWFQSFCPGLAPFRLLVERDSVTDELQEALKEFSVELEIALQEEHAAWEKAFNGEGSSQ